MSRPRFDAVFFDSGGTLYRGGDHAGPQGRPARSAVRAGRRGRLLAALRGLGLTVDEAALARELIRAETELPAKLGASYTFVRLIEFVAERLSLRVFAEEALLLADAYAGARFRHWLCPGTHEMLEALREAGLFLGVIANTSWPGFSMDRAFAGVGLLAFFAVRVYSGDEGVAKPDRAIFDLAAARADLSDQRILYVGDHLVCDLEGAHAAGWQMALRRPASTPADRTDAEFEFDDNRELTDWILNR